MLFTYPLALMLGFKHSYDPDHLIAVSNILSKTRSFRESVQISVSWALGHMLTATIITITLFYFKEFFLTKLLEKFDLLVGVMLVVLGILTLNDLRRAHYHKHAHTTQNRSHFHPHSGEDRKHTHRHMFGIGIIHGLASNDELLLLLTVSLSISTLPGLLLGVLLFSIGVVLGMVAYGLIFSYPLIKARADAIKKAIILVSGTLSIIYGIAMIAAVQ